jgi:choline dehydrogenase
LRIVLSQPSREGRAAALPSLRDQTERVIARPEAFDVVIVGGGAAGCVVSARLADSASQSVLLLEAGPDLRAKLPDELRDGWRMTEEFDWGYASEPDARGEVEDLRRGKLLGGTSWVTRFAPRGSPADYDEWVALGNPGWGFDDLLPDFTRLEADADFGDQSWHGDRGPMPVSRYPGLALTEIAAAGLQALEAAGFPIVDDHNRPGAVGAGRMPMSSREGIRVTTADAYLPIGSMPPNLTVRSNAQVAEVVFDGTRATGVSLVDGRVIEAGWVVLCAGTYGSPPILMRSGIGPADHLRSVEIPVRVNLPGVGANLADHAGVDVDCGFRGSARAPILHLLATFHSASRSSEDAPDLMLWLSDPRGDPPIFEIDVGLLKPRSRGTVRLHSADPVDPPRIELPNRRDPSDVERLCEGYRRALEVASRPEIRRLCADPPPPEPRADDELRALIRAEGYSFPHVVGTCSMGPRPDDGAVVDASGRVHGTERLSVIDASIMPTVPSGFTHIPTVMLAERLSREIASLS